MEETSYLNCSDSYDETGGHGTAVAGVIGAANNSVDVVGVAPQATIFDFNVGRYDPGHVFCPGDQTNCLDPDRIKHAMSYIIAHHSTTIPPIKVVNMSFGGPFDPQNPDVEMESLMATLDQANVILVAAAGNDPTVTVPARYPANSTHVMAIASTTALLGSDDGNPCNAFPHVVADAASWYTTDGQFSNEVGVTISAPGEDSEDMAMKGRCTNATTKVCSTDADCPADPPGGVCANYQCRPWHVGTYSLMRYGGLMRAAGTSIASPVVAGVVALMEQQAGSGALTLDDARARIRSSANLRLQVPYDSPYLGMPPGTGGYTYDGEREGIVWSALVSLLPQEQDQSYLPAVPFEVGANPIALATADLDRDGRKDLAIPSRDAGRRLRCAGRSRRTRSARRGGAAAP
jgi:subtilisin family serine protease